MRGVAPDTSLSLLGPGGELGRVGDGAEVACEGCRWCGAGLAGLNTDLIRLFCLSIFRGVTAALGGWAEL